MTMLSQLLVQDNVLLLRSLVPEAHFIQLGGEVTHVVGRVLHAVLLPVGFHYIVIGTPAIKQFDQAPLLGRKTEQLVCAANVHHDNRPPFADVLRPDGRADRAAESLTAGLLRRQFRQRGIQCLCEIHGVLGTRIDAVIPGRNPDGFVSTAMTSTVPLAGIDHRAHMDNLGRSAISRCGGRRQSESGRQVSGYARIARAK